MEKPKLKVLDIIFIIILLSLTIFSYFYFYSSESGIVKIKTEDSVYRYSMNENQEIVLSGPLGETIIQIDDNGAKITESPCPNQTCIEQGHIHKGSDVLACLPNKIIITIEGESEIDALSR